MAPPQDGGHASTIDGSASTDGACPSSTSCIDAGIGLDAAPTSCGTRCSTPGTHWDPYAESCVVDATIDPDVEAYVCGCDGVTYLNAAVAARRGVRDSVTGRCEPVLPVERDPICHGDAFGCQHFSLEECETQVGCTGDPGYCDGLTVECRDIASETDCTNRRGCQWEVPSGEPGSCQGGVGGRSTSCGDLTGGRPACEAQLGCRWSEISLDCFGTSILCENFLSSQTCNAQEGCAWNELVP